MDVCIYIQIRDALFDFPAGLYLIGSWIGYLKSKIMDLKEVLIRLEMPNKPISLRGPYMSREVCFQSTSWIFVGWYSSFS